MLANIFFLQLNTSILLQNIGLVIIQAIFSAPVYGLAMYWGVRMAIKHSKLNGDNK